MAYHVAEMNGATRENAQLQYWLQETTYQDKKNDISFSQEVKHKNSPVVALESTIITHGMPYPKSCHGRSVEDDIRAAGAAQR